MISRKHPHRVHVSIAKAISIIRKAELQDYREYIEDRPQPYTRYVIDADLLARINPEHPRLK